jgi:hypothetical protein
MKFIAKVGIILVLGFGCGYGQSSPGLAISTAPGCSHYAEGEKHLPNVPECAVLACPKYQHRKYTPGHCANTCDPQGMACTSQCLWVPEVNVCEDNVHFVTEREWQAMLDTQEHLLKALTEILDGLDNQAKFNVKMVEELNKKGTK